MIKIQPMKKVKEPRPMNFDPDPSAEPPLVLLPVVPVAVGGGVVVVPPVGFEDDGTLELVEFPPMVLTGVHCDDEGAGCGGGV